MIANEIVISKLTYGLAMWGNCQAYLNRVLITEQIMLATGLNTAPIYTNKENPKKNLKKC